MAAAYTRSLFGEKHFSLNFGIFNLQNIPAAFGSMIAGAMVTASGGYRSSCLLLAALLTAGALLCLSVRRAKE